MEEGKVSRVKSAKRPVKTRRSPQYCRTAQGINQTPSKGCSPPSWGTRAGAEYIYLRGLQAVQAQISDPPSRENK